MTHFKRIALSALILTGLACAGGQMPARAELGPVGGGGGEGFERSCGSLYVTGLRYRAGDFVDQLSLICGLAPGEQINSPDDPRAGAGDTRPVGGTGGRRAGNAECQPGSYVTGLTVYVRRLSDGFTAVRTMRVICTDPKTREVNELSIIGTLDSQAGREAQRFDLFCPANITGGFPVLKGINGRAGGLVDAVGIQCGALPAPEPVVQVPARLGDTLVYAADGRGLMGFAHGYTDKAEAERLALEGCGGEQSGCSIVMSERGACMAFSESTRDDGAYWFYVSFAGDLAAAERFANDFCRGSPHPSGCALRHSVCNETQQAPLR